MFDGLFNEYTNVNDITNNRNTLLKFQNEVLRKNMKAVEAIIEFVRTREMTAV